VFSRRTSAPHELNRLALALAARTRPFLDLTATNPTSVALRSGEADLFDGARSGRDARVLAALADARGLVYTPDPKGILSARTAVSNYYAAVHGALVPPGQIVLAASSSEAYGWLFKLAGDPGDVVLVPAPSYPLLDALAELESLTLHRYALASEDSFAAHAAAVEAEVRRAEAAGHRVAAVVLVNPNNPTGTSLAGAELSTLFALAKERGFAVISDEVFVDFRYSDRPHDVRIAASAPDAERALVFSLGGLSKSAALPQLKLGWIFANGPAALLEDALERLELYRATVDPAVLDLAGILGPGVEDKRVWTGMKARFSALVAGRRDAELLETFFNSASRRIFHTVGVDDRAEFVTPEPALRPSSASASTA